MNDTVDETDSVPAKRVSVPRKAKAPGKATNAARAAAAAARKASGAPRKSTLVRDMLLRPEGVTVKEVLAATGWTAISMPQTARTAKLSIRKSDDRPARYFGTAL
jgi:hypothetical protein